MLRVNAMEQDPISLPGWQQQARDRAFSPPFLYELKRVFLPLARRVPPLEMDDVFGIVIERTRSVLIRDYLPPGPLKLEEVNVCSQLAVDAVILAAPEMAMIAGVSPRHQFDKPFVEEYIRRWRWAWYERLRDSNRASSPTERQCAINRCMKELQVDLVVDANALGASLLEASRLWYRHHRDSQNASRNQSEALGALIIALSEPHRFIGKLYKTGDGRLQVSPLGLRDMMGRTKANEPLKSLADSINPAISTRKPTPREQQGDNTIEGLDSDETECPDSDETEGLAPDETDGLVSDVRDPLYVLEAAEAIQAARAAKTAMEISVARRLREARPGSARAHVLEHYFQLQAKEVGIEELARKVGMAHSSISRAWALELEETDQLPQVMALITLLEP